LKSKLTILIFFFKWPRELNTLKLKKTHANTSKFRKHHQSNNTCATQPNKDTHCKYSQLTILFILTSWFLIVYTLWVFAARFCIWLCWEYLQHVSVFDWIVHCFFVYCWCLVWCIVNCNFVMFLLVLIVSL